MGAALLCSWCLTIFFVNATSPTAKSQVKSTNLCFLVQKLVLYNICTNSCFLTVHVAFRLTCWGMPLQGVAHPQPIYDHSINCKNHGGSVARLVEHGY
jgi:hypothetical protein